jgi:hypothetical protein
MDTKLLLRPHPANGIRSVHPNITILEHPPQPFKRPCAAAFKHRTLVQPIIWGKE